ncbi:regulatory protein GemA [Psychromonas sp. MME2]|uniref:gp16 family protein n=1 Tax=unclassified Psychromonas TaxID=2614957 RepID=UPI00339BD88F
MAYPVSIKTLITKIHIAKGQLGLDDDLYRAILKEATDKTSCSEMNFAELMMVLHSMEKRGFKAKAPTNKNGKRFSRPSDQTAYSRKPQDKIVAIWITMQRHGFVKDGSETALDKFINNQTRQTGMFAVTSLRFLSPQQASKIIETLKKWHIREMTKALTPHEVVGVMPYADLVNHFNNMFPGRDSTHPRHDIDAEDEK